MSDGSWALFVAAGLVIAASLVLVILARRTMGQVLREVAEVQGRLDGMLRDEIARFRGEVGGGLRDQRLEVSAALDRLVANLSRSLEEMRQAESTRQEALRGTVEGRLDALRQENAQALEEVRKVVDERLQTTLDQRLGESFARVGQQLEGVHRGLGEMTAMAAGLADVRRMLSNVKVRGTWGEVQLRTLLDEVLLPSQFDCNVATRPGSSDRVEFAIRLPGSRDEGPVWLPIDAKFPQEDFQRLLEASDRGDSEAVDAAAKALEARVRQMARTIREKYVAPPATTDFAILYLPLESLYAEVLRRPGLVESLQREHRVIVAGPTTIAALLNALQVGFHSLALEHRSQEVLRLLGAVKGEFERFGEALARAEKRIGEAGRALEQVGTRTRVMVRRLRDVEAGPATQESLQEDEDEVPPGQDS
ncbi:MAG TPA: DNA recombination protein RmuC [Myxococcota bacterium]|nr:DNA recombination protein RmuC [Myxococcota bacterium]HQK50375.1 DNA recombination protein RmuC [Myxococcota bacterium]